MTIKRVREWDLVATGDACEFSMAGAPEYMREGLTPSKPYVGYIKHVDTMHHEYQVVITDDNGKIQTITHYADPVREPIGMPLYFLLEVLLDKDTYLERLRTRQKREIKYLERKHQENLERAQKRVNESAAKWETLPER